MGRKREVKDVDSEPEQVKTKKVSRSHRHREDVGRSTHRLSENEIEAEKKEPKKDMDILKTRTGGAYIPPAKLKLMQEQISDKNSEQYQRVNWERLKKRIHGQVNKANTGNLLVVIRDLLQENIIRGRGLLARSIIQAQAYSPTFSNVYAAMVAIINSQFPNIGMLIIHRLLIQFKRCYKRNDKITTVNIAKFIAHLVNQQVIHEILALELMILMLENPTDDSVEVTVAFLKECGAKLADISPRGLNAIFDRLRNILNESQIDKRIQYMIEVIFHVRKDKFQAYPAVVEELDLIEEDDQITHTMTLEDALLPENELNVFKFDPEFEKHELEYEEIRQDAIGDVEENDVEQMASDGEGAELQEDEDQTTTIIDNTEQNLVAFRRNVYLTIQSSLDFQEAAHKLLKIDLKSGQDAELCNMIVDCCAQQRTYEKFYGLLAERFCRLRKEFQETFERIARDTYNTIHRFDYNKLRNMACLIAHLLSSDAISWNVLNEISLNEEDTTSAGRIYIKIVFQELAEFLGVESLMQRIRDPTMQSAFDKIFPRDNPNNTRFSINFFTTIGLGYLTIDLRLHLEQTRKQAKAKIAAAVESSSEDSSSSLSSSSDSGEDSSSHDTDSGSNDKSNLQSKMKKKFTLLEVKEEIPSPVHSPPVDYVKIKSKNKEKETDNSSYQKLHQKGRADRKSQEVINAKDSVVVEQKKEKDGNDNRSVESVLKSREKKSVRGDVGDGKEAREERRRSVERRWRKDRKSHSSSPIDNERRKLHRDSRGKVRERRRSSTPHKKKRNERRKKRHNMRHS